MQEHLTTDQAEKLIKAGVANVAKKIAAGKVPSKSDLELLESSKPKTGMGVSPTMTAAAGRLGMPVALLQHCKGLGWKCFKTSNRVNCDEFAAEIAKHPNILAQFNSIPNEQVEKALILRSRRMAMEDRRAEQRKELVSLFDVKRFAQQYIGGAKDRLLASVHSIVAAAGADLKLEGDAQVMLREIIQREHNEVLAALQRGEWFKG